MFAKVATSHMFVLWQNFYGIQHLSEGENTLI
jgi:hypothetical protein